jgi:NhaP-type Na+/H+ or K+/H+ antiporter
MNHQQPVIDLAIAMISIPTLIIFALMLESNMREDWTERPETRWTVLGLGVGLLLVSIMICGYVTHRMGVCLWTGPLEDDSNYQANLQRVCQC